MRVDRDLFMDQGYLVIPGIIPQDKLDAMRASCETILERQKVVWARERQPGDPPGGQWETARQPRVMMERPRRPPTSSRTSGSPTGPSTLPASSSVTPCRM